MTFFTKNTIIVLLLAISGFFTPVLADDKAEASQFVTHLGQQAMQIVTSSRSADDKSQSLQALFSDNVDVDTIAKFVLGRSYKAATDEQKQSYLQNYRKFLLTHYTSSFNEFTNVNFEVTKTIPSDQGGYVVTMRIKRPQAEDIIVDYSVRKASDNKLKVYDITVEGISMATTQRSEFASVIQEHGMDYLIQQLAERAEKEKS